jgi:urease accessory protein
MKENPSIEIRNPKQIQNSNTPIFRTGFKKSVLNFSHSNLFRVWIFGFRILLFGLALFVSVSLVFPARAEAHLMNTGFGPFYDGLTHLFVTPEDLLQVIALALLAGLRGPRFGRAVLFVLPAGWLLGSIAGLISVPPITLTVATAISVISLGVLVAADRPLPTTLIAGIAILIGLFNGGLNGTELAKAQSGAWVAAGIACAIFVVVSILAGQVTSMRALWARITVRVAGSWIAACGLFMLGWVARVN